MNCNECGEFIKDIDVDDLVDKHFQPATPARTIAQDREVVLGSGLDRIASAIDRLPGDPGKLYPLDERVRRVIGALQARAR